MYSTYSRLHDNVHSIISSITHPTQVHVIGNHCTVLYINPNSIVILHIQHQVPLSALCSPRAIPGAIGGPFNSTTKVKCLPLPTVYNRHQFSSRGIRNVGLHSDRYLPISDQQRRRTVSDSLLNLSKLHTRQKEHLVHCETNVHESRTLQKQREVIPHRVEQAFYMSGLPAQLFNREDIPQSELEVLQKIALSQNTHLFYGRGIRSCGGKPSKTVQRYEKRLHDTVSAQNTGYGLEDTGIDTGRYSRASRAVTPGSPIMEEKGEDISEHIARDVSSQRTFITDSNK